MSKIKEKKNEKKLIIMIAIIMLFNFAMPTYSHAGILLNFFARITLIIPDAILEGLSGIFVGNGNIKKENGDYCIRFSPGIIFSGTVPAFDANFIKTKSKEKKTVQKSFETDELKIDFDNQQEIFNEDGIIHKLIKTGVLYDANNDKKLLETEEYISEDEVHDFIENGWTSADNKTVKDALDAIDMIIADDTKNNEIINGRKSVQCKDSKGNKYDITIRTFANGKWETTGEKINLIIYNYEITDDKYNTTYRVYAKMDVKFIEGYGRGMDSIVQQLRNFIATWYKALKEFALVGLLVALVYIAIRMIISSASSKKARYKKMLVGWFEAICILFLLQYIISLSFVAVQSITDVFSEAVVQPNGEDKLITEIRNNIEQEVDDDKFKDAFFDIIIYLVLVIYTISFAVQYLKRVVYLAFLILISPLIALTYPLDKIKDSKAQAFEIWLKEFIFNLLIQPIHLILYNLLVVNAIELVDINKIYGVIAIGSLLPAEKFIRKMFGLDKAESEGKMASALGGAAIMNSISKIGKKGPKKGKTGDGKKGSNGGKPNIRKANAGLDAYSALRNNANGVAPMPNMSNAQANTGTQNQSSRNTSGGSKSRTIKNKPGTRKNRLKGIAKLGAKGGAALMRGASKGIGAVALGTIGLAAGMTMGDMSKAVGGLTGGLVAGKNLGGKVIDGITDIPQKLTGFGNEIVETYREGAYGKDEAKKIKARKEFEKSADYKNLMKKYPKTENDIIRFFDEGITDTKQMDTALENMEKGKYSFEEALTYMKMAKKCPESILYDKEGFRKYLNSYKIDESNADEIREILTSFKE